MTLQQLVNAAFESNTTTNTNKNHHAVAGWDDVLEYLKVHSKSSEEKTKTAKTTVTNNTTRTISESSALASTAVPSELLFQEITLKLFQQCVLYSAPMEIVASLIQLKSNMLSEKDDKQRLLLHHACRYPPTNNQEHILRLLIHAYPLALVQQDVAGRTPLHYALWFHVDQRTPESIQRFLMVSNNNTNNNKQSAASSGSKKQQQKLDCYQPAMITDTNHGCLPLHYAVMNQASVAVIALLLQAAPQSAHAVDFQGRTVLHWYLGAEYLQQESDRQPLHVSGEAMNPHGAPWYTQRLDPAVMQMLMNSRVARTLDRQGRCPMHWAAHFWACQYHSLQQQQRLETKENINENTTVTVTTSSQSTNDVLPLGLVKMVLDQHIKQLTTRDNLKQTPLMVLLDMTLQLREREASRKDMLTSGWSLPLEYIKLLMEPFNASAIALCEDEQGRLPLHVALQAAAPASVVSLLLQAHPMALLHATEETGQVPLHCALTKYPAPLQTLEVVELLLQSYSLTKYGTHVNGRMAIKMEDANGLYPIHYACFYNAPLPVFKALLKQYPQAARMALPNGCLPVHALLDEALIHMALTDEKALSSVAQAQLEIVRQKMMLVLEPLLYLEDAEAKLKIEDSQFGFLPLHIAVLFQVVSYPVLLQMLQVFPEAASIYTAHSTFSFSCLDLHDIVRTNWKGKNEEWQLIRELLFAFGPTLESHRHREELLSHCVSLIINEVRGQGSEHLRLGQMAKEMVPELELTHTLSNLQLAPVVLERRQGRDMDIERGQKETKVDDKFSVKTIKQLGVSQYDDHDLRLGYDINEVNTDIDDDDDSYFSVENSVEEELYMAGGSEWMSSEPTLTGSSYNASLSLATTKTNSMEADKHDQAFVQPGKYSEDALEKIDRVFDDAKRKAEEISHIMDDGKSVTGMSLNLMNSNNADGSVRLPSGFSDVAMRLWTFFALYRDANNPNDNYAKQVNDIFDKVEFVLIQQLISLKLPEYSQAYISREDQAFNTTTYDVAQLTYRDAASPKCRALMYMSSHFLGRFDFSGVEDVLVKHAKDSSFVTVRAFEWSYKTEETTDAMKPGISEASVWASGEVPTEVSLTFRPSKKPIRIKFIKDHALYKNEINSRRSAGVRVGDVFGNAKDQETGVVPIEYTFDGSHPQSKDDHMYCIQLEDPRFRWLSLTPTDDVDLSGFPYAIVCGDGSYQGTLSEQLDRCGATLVLAKQVASDICGVVGSLHDSNIVCPSLLTSNIHSSMDTDANGNTKRTWMLSDLSHAVCQEDGVHSGRIVASGGQYATVLLPPEMFVSLATAELTMYRAYWQTIQEKFNIVIDKSVIEPRIDLTTGKSYVVKCHFVSNLSKDADATGRDLPPLPYDLVPLSTSFDVWAMGQLLFRLCAGRPLFAYDEHTGDLFEYNGVCNWSAESAKALVYGYVTDIAAQDLLIQLLAPDNERQNLNFHDLIRHPFLAQNISKPFVFEEKRRVEAAAFERQLAVKEAEETERKDLEARTLKINCWDMAVLERIHLSVTQMLRRMLRHQPWREPDLHFPCAVLILPYRLLPVLDSDAELIRESETASCVSEASHKRIMLSDDDMEKSEQLGLAFLSLSKALLFTTRLQAAISNDKSTHDALKCSVVDVWDIVALKREDFGDLNTVLSLFISQHVELYRQDPVAIAVKIVQSRISRFMSCFEGCSTFLYMVDEHTYTPVINEHYPLQVGHDKAAGLLQSGLIMSYLVSLTARGCREGLEGLAILVGREFDSTIPSSWVEAAEGLSHKHDEKAFLDEIDVLQVALSDMCSSRHRLAMEDLDFLRAFLYENDLHRNFADLQRVSASDMILWTTVDQACSILETSRASSFEMALKISKSNER